ncbi:MAG: NPCBM/NEW2 domain-containing protein, partial [Planctomycetaceae bacterium]|nr:NPCBM/NEW2 domain-containing protein [Planctomycetaceae bacterium]
MKIKHVSKLARLTVIALIVCFASYHAMAETYYIDSLNLSVTECGWRTTQSRRSVEGNPMSIGGRKFDRGVGHHPPGV